MISWILTPHGQFKVNLFRSFTPLFGSRSNSVTLCRILTGILLLPQLYSMGIFLKDFPWFIKIIWQFVLQEHNKLEEFTFSFKLFLNFLLRWLILSISFYLFKLILLSNLIWNKLITYIVFLKGDKFMGKIFSHWINPFWERVFIR